MFVEVPSMKKMTKTTTTKGPAEGKTLPDDVTDVKIPEDTTSVVQDKLRSKNKRKAQGRKKVTSTSTSDNLIIDLTGEVRIFNAACSLSINSPPGLWGTRHPVSGRRGRKSFMLSTLTLPRYSVTDLFS